MRPNLLAQIVSRSEKTHEEIVEGFNQCARKHREDAALSVRTLRRWIVGDLKTQPRPSQRRVARLYWGFTMEELLAPVLTGGVVGERASRSLLSAQIKPNLTSNLEDRITVIARRSVNFARESQSGLMGAEALAQIQDDTYELAGQYLKTPAVMLIGELADLQDLIFGFLESGKQRPRDMRELYVMASLVSTLLAKTMQDIGKYREAVTMSRTAFMCAENADHKGLQAWARGTLSLIAYRRGDLHEAIRIADSAAHFAQNVSGTTRVWVHSLRARAQAQLGMEDDARAAIRASIDASEIVTRDDLDAIGGLFFFPQPKQSYYAAGALAFVGDAGAEAEAAALTALEFYSDREQAGWCYSTEAGTRSELALSRVLQGELEGAIEAFQPVLDLPPERRITGIVDSANRVYSALQATPQSTRGRLSRDLSEQIEDFRRISAVSLLQ